MKYSIEVNLLYTLYIHKTKINLYKTTVKSILLQYVILTINILYILTEKLMQRRTLQ